MSEKYLFIGGPLDGEMIDTGGRPYWQAPVAMPGPKNVPTVFHPDEVGPCFTVVTYKSERLHTQGGQKIIFYIQSDDNVFKAFTRLFERYAELAANEG